MSLRGLLGHWRHRARFALHGAREYRHLAASRNGRPYGVTAVVVGRNDDYMPDFLGRLQATIAWNTAHVADDVVFVEWNPPADRPLLATPLTARFPQLRAFVVGEDVHAALCPNARLPLLEYHAKNAGIRRAQGELVVATNADVAFGPDCVLALRSWMPSPDVLWTAQRIDIPWPDFANRRVGLADCVRYRRIIPYSELGTGDFQAATRAAWERARGYDESLTQHRIGCDARGGAHMSALGIHPQRVGTILHLHHPTSCTEEVRPHHGEWAHSEDVPYDNGPDWGLGQLHEREIAERVWRLE